MQLILTAPRRLVWVAVSAVAAALAALVLAGSAQALVEPAAPGDSQARNGGVELVWTQLVAADLLADGSHPSAATIRYRWTNTLAESSPGWVTIPGSVTLIRSHLVTGLKNGVQYTFTVQAFKADGTTTGDPLTVVRTPTTTAAVMPGDPQNVTATLNPATGETSWVTLSWDAPAENASAVTGYEYQWTGPSKADRGTTWIKVGKATSITLRSLDNGDHDFWVRSLPAAADETGQDTAAEVTVTNTVATGGAVDLTGDLSATASSGSVKLSWTGPFTTVLGETYEIQYRTASPEWIRYKALTNVSKSGGSATVGETVTATVSGLSNGTSYMFRVRALDNSKSPGTSITSAAVTPGGSTTAPQGLVAVANDGFATLYLDKPADGTVDLGMTADTPPVHDGTYKYQVWLVPDSFLDHLTGDDRWAQRPTDFEAVAGDPTRLQGTVTGLTNGVSYSIRVRALKDEAGGAYASVSVTPSTTAGTAPAQRPGFELTATRGSSSVTLTWPNQNNRTIDHYQVRDSSQKAASDWTDSDWRNIPGSNQDTTAYVVTGLTDGTTVSFQIRAMSRGAGVDTTLNTEDDTFAEISRSSVAMSVVGIDTSQPDTQIVSGPTSGTSEMTATFVLSSSESNVTYTCKLDDGPYEACDSTTTVTVTSYGMHTFEAKATDDSGNADPIPAVYTWSVVEPEPEDTTAPSTTIDVVSPTTDPTNATSATFVLEADEDGVTFHCSLNDEAFAPCESVVRYSDLPSGTHTFSAMAMDAAGNVGEMVSQTWTITSANLTGCTIIGTEGDDNLVGTEGDDVICGLGGNDVIHGRGGNDEIRGGAGGDVINGGAGNDMIYGGSGNDRIQGNAGDDMIHGGSGVDMIRGGKGNDNIRGGGGDDTIYGDKGADTIIGGPGNDSAKVDDNDSVRKVENIL